MGRVSMGLRSWSRIACHWSIAGTAAAQSTQPPPDISQAPSSTAPNRAQGGEIVVTGSRIRRDPLSQDQPIVFVDQDDIAKTGLNSVNDVLQRLPSSGGGLNSKFNNSGNLGNPPDGGGVGAGAAEIDLRYLGSRRVLVLVDGIRYVNGASASGVPGSTDLNSIPDSAIERIEVLQDGASAIYGSDAIAGVVNIITKKRQKGFDATAQLGGYRGRRRLHPELSAQLGQWRRRAARGRRRRQLCEAGLGQIRRSRHFALSRRPIRRPAPTAAAPASRDGPFHRSSRTGFPLIGCRIAC